MHARGRSLSGSKLKNASKWLLLAPELFRAPGGIARVSRHYLQAMEQSRGIRELEVVTLNDAPITAKQLDSVGASGLKATGCSRSKIRCAAALWRATRGESVHATCTHVGLSSLLLALSWLRPNLSFDVVVHGIEVWQNLSPWRRWALSRARIVLSVSNYTRQDLVSRYPQLKAHCRVLPNALDPSFEWVDCQDVSTVPGRILAVSRLAAHDGEKGIDHLIESLPRVRSRIAGAHLRIVGDGVDRARLEDLAQKTPEPDQIEFIGQVSDEDLRRELANCEVFALPSRKEGFGLVYLEAMAAGKPCIVAQAGGAPEVIDRDSGIIVPYGDVQSLSDALASALSVKWDVCKIQQRARSFAYSVFVNRWLTLTSENP